MFSFKSLQDCRDICNKITIENIERLALQKIANTRLTYSPRIVRGGATKIAVIGCQGHNAPAKAIIAKNMAAQNPDLMIGLGDSFYKHGVSHYSDPLFETHFENYYSRGSLATIPFFSVLGNHDMNFQNAFHSFFGSLQGITPYDRMMGQILRTYSSRNLGKNWRMPNAYYALVLPHANIFFLNSNLLAFEDTQQEWLEQTYQQLNSTGPKKWNIVSMHHPLNSPGKRYIEKGADDIDQYYLPEFKQEIANHKKNNIKNINMALLQYFAKLSSQDNINFELFLSAHDHLLAAMWQREWLPQSWQIISAAAGDPDELQAVKLPDRFSIKTDKINGASVGKDFAISLSGHVTLDIQDSNNLTVNILDTHNISICRKIFTRAGSNVSCIDLEPGDQC